ncbi:MAG: hypothetical protein JO261_12690 [Alphaproteobacteria bacterium]|nr:hypothetical protein [Alphaproteobacteria bacterium]MBV9694548.1 hypothetical protein [Alphaproteobacteria bacterium]
MRVLPAALFTALALCTGPSLAAVTVLGPGPAQECYRLAEDGGDPVEGIKQCTSALDDSALSPVDRAATMVNRGVLHLARREYTAGFRDIDAGIALSPALADGYVDRGAALISMGRYDEALADLNKGISLGPHQPQKAYYDRAIVDEHNGDIRAAYNDYRKALDLQPDFALAAEELKRFRVVHPKTGI